MCDDSYTCASSSLGGTVGGIGLVIVGHPFDTLVRVLVYLTPTTL